MNSNMENFIKWMYEEKFTISADDGQNETSSILQNSNRSRKIDRLQLYTKLYSSTGKDYIYSIKCLAKDWESMGNPHLNEEELYNYYKENSYL